MIALYTTWLGCSGTDTSDDSPTDTTDQVTETGTGSHETGTTPPPSVDAYGGPSALVPSVIDIRVAESGHWHVEWGTETLDRTTPDVDGTRLDLRGARAGSVVQWRVVGTDDQGVARASAIQTYAVPSVPALLPNFNVEIDGDPGWNYLVTTILMPEPINRSALMVLDRTGAPVWWVLGDTRLTYVTPMLTYEDGEPVLGWVQTDDDMVEDVGKLVQVPLSGAWRRETRLPSGHHSAVVHDDGSVAYLTHIFGQGVWQPVGVVDEVSDGLVVGRIGQGDDAQPTELFDHFTDFPTRPRVACIHTQPPLTKFGVPDVREVTHANSMVYVPEDDAYAINDKFTDWLYEVDRQTGEVKWVLNGENSDFTNPDGTPVWTSPDDTTLWSHGHTSEVWSGGVLMFDNGDHRDPPYSRVMEVSWNTTTRIAKVEWVHDHPDHGYTLALGDAHRLPDDRVLITWSQLGSVEVVRRDHTTDWRMRVPGATSGRLFALDALY